MGVPIDGPDTPSDPMPKQKPDTDSGKGGKLGKDIGAALGGAGKAISDTYNQKAQAAIAQMAGFKAAQPVSVNVPGAMPSYQKGCKSVPKTGPALLHKGERVVPANQNRMKSGKRFSSGRGGGR